MDDKDHDRLIDRLLREVAGDNEAKALRAFDQLRRDYDPWLKPFVYSLGGIARREMEDIVQDTSVKLWQNRVKLGELTHKTWPSYVFRTARNCTIDLYRYEKGEFKKLMQQIESLPEKDQWEVRRFYELLDRDNRLEQFLDYADVLWLGLDPALPLGVHQRQVLAAKYHYIDAAPYDEIIELLALGPNGSLLTPAILDAWLTDDGVIRALAYQELFVTKDRLAWYLLGKHDPVRVQYLDQLCAEISREGNMLTPVIAVILWRYRYSIRPEQILARTDCPCGREQLFCLLASLEERLPFYNQMEQITALLATKLGIERVRAVLGTPGIWQRLAFQYNYLEELGTDDICRRLAASAHSVGYDVNASNLNMWLSGKRLIDRLAKTIVRFQGRTTDE